MKIKEITFNFLVPNDDETRTRLIQLLTDIPHEVDDNQFLVSAAVAKRIHNRLEYEGLDCDWGFFTISY